MKRDSVAPHTVSVTSILLQLASDLSGHRKFELKRQSVLVSASQNSLLLTLAPTRSHALVDAQTACPGQYECARPESAIAIEPLCTVAEMTSECSGPASDTANPKWAVDGVRMKRGSCAPLHCAIVVQRDAAFERMGAAGRVANLTQTNENRICPRASSLHTQKRLTLRISCARQSNSKRGACRTSKMTARYF